MSLANPTAILDFERQVNGTNNNTWNDHHNAQWLRIENAIAGNTGINVTTGNVSLTTVDSTDFAADAQQRYAALEAIGTPIAPRSVILVAALPGKTFLLINSTGQLVTFLVSGRTGVTLSPGDQARAFCTSTDLIQEVNFMGKARFLSTGLYIHALGTNPVTAQSPGVAMMATGDAYIWSAVLPPLTLGVPGGSTYFEAFYVGSTFAGAIVNSGGVVAYQSVSDYRLKVTHGPADTGALIDSIPVHDAAFLAAPDVRRPMLLAHEVQAVAPWLVRGEKDAMHDGKIMPQTLDQSGLVPALLAEVKSLRARVLALENERRH